MTTSIEDLKKYAGGSEVELPGFIPEEPLIVKLRRPSLLDMAETGSIPNPLLPVAAELFKNGADVVGKTGSSLIDTAKIMKCIARAAMVEPTYKDFESAGLNLTDMQLMYIYNYVQTGLDSLRIFREKQGSIADHKSGGGTEKKSQQYHGNRR